MLAARWFVNPAFTRSTSATPGGVQADEVLSQSKMDVPALGETAPAAVSGWGSRFVLEAKESLDPKLAWAYDLAAGSGREIASLTRLLKNRT
jgi:hypothetical protein